MSQQEDVARQYLRILEAVGEAVGRRRGWQKRLAAVIGVSGSYLSKTLSGAVPAGAEAARRLADAWNVPDSYFTSDDDPPEELVRGLADAVITRTERRVPLERASPSEPGYRPPLVNAHRLAVWQLRGAAVPLGGGREMGEVKYTAAPDQEAIVAAILETKFIQYLVAYELKRAGKEDYALPLGMVTSQFINDFAELVAYLRQWPDEPTIYDFLDEVKSATGRM